MTAPEIVLHLGAPKCGSSALQSALTARPDHRAGGLRLRYVAGRPVGDDLRLVSGWRLRMLARRSPFQYLSWPNAGPKSNNTALFSALQLALARGRRAGFVPMLSCEGWVAHPERFAAALADMGHPPVDAVVYLRPPLDWINAAWWQWGVWGGRTFDDWLDGGSMTYRFGPLLEAWAAIPGLRLRIRPARPDVVADFAALYGLCLPALQVRNTAIPPSLTGFFLRNRLFRHDPHDAAAEFVFQRWCPPTAESRPWAVLARHVHRLRPLVAETRVRIAAMLTEAERETLFADPRWHREVPYHAAIQAGTSRLDDPAALPGLYAALARGVEAVSGAIGRPVPALPDPAPDTASLSDWDPVLAAVFDTLLAQDADWRAGSAWRLARRVSGRVRTEPAARDDTGAGA